MRPAVALGVAVLLSPWAARAQTPDDDDAGATIRATRPSPEVYEHSLPASDLAQMPGTRGDALLAVQNLPGVGRPQLGVAGFVLRGSDPSDSLVTLEGHPIATPFHFQGLASTIATDLIDRLEVIPGNFSARWGRAAGGVIDVTLRSPSRDAPHLSADVDIIDAGVFASTPLGRHASAAVGARRSYLDAVLDLALPPGFSQIPTYWDYQAAVELEPSREHRVRIVAAGSDDALVYHFDVPDPSDPSLRGTLGSRTGSHTVQARWRFRPSASVTHNLSPAVSFIHTDVSLGSEVRYLFDTVTFSLRDDLSVRLSPHLILNTGLDLQAGSTDAAITAPPLDSTGISDPLLPGRMARYEGVRAFFHPAGWVEAELSPSRAVRLVTGLRVDHFSHTDTTTLSPRASWRVALGRSALLRGGFGIFTTPPRGYATLPGFGNPNLTPERWTHSTLGVVFEAVPGLVEVSLDGFYKSGAEVVAPMPWTAERFGNVGLARIYGAEVYARLRRQGFPWFATVSYTLQRAERQDRADAPWVPSTWDQPHLFTALVGVAAGRGWELGARVRYTSGITEPTVTGGLYDADHDVSQTFVDPLHPGRLPDFFALDLRAAKRWRRRWGAVQVIFEVLNATNHANAESRIYSFDRRTSAIVTGLPILPNVGLRLEL